MCDERITLRPRQQCAFEGSPWPATTRPGPAPATTTHHPANRATPRRRKLIMAKWEPPAHVDGACKSALNPLLLRAHIPE